MIGTFSGLLLCRAPSAIASTPTPALFRGLSSGLHSLVLAEQSHGSLSSSTLHVLSAAAKVSSKVDVLVTGQGAASCAKAVASVAGVGQVLVAEHESLHQQAAEAVSALLAAVQRKRSYSHLLAPASTFGKNILPRAAALLDCQPVSDVIGVVDADTYQRPVYAGNAVATVRYPGGTGLRMLTVRPTAFEAAATGQAGAPVEALSEEEIGAAAEAGCGVQVESEEVRKSERPQLGSARVVVCGGRALKSAENFKMLEELADAIGGGAVGASRAAVDAGYVPNDLQVGQTGKVVAPELYIGVGISGAIQHLAGMKDSRTIVAINTDAEAPIFQVADYGLVQDLFIAVPELTAAVKAAKAAA